MDKIQQLAEFLQLVKMVKLAKTVKLNKKRKLGELSERARFPVYLPVQLWSASSCPSPGRKRRFQRTRSHTVRPFCEVIRLINIDYNVIVVHKGHHGSTTERRFIEQAIQDSVWANDTPAAPVLYRITLKRLTENEVATQWCHLILR